MTDQVQSLDYGYVAAGNAAVRSFTVRCEGTEPVTVSEVSITFDSARDFRLTGDSLNFNAG